MLFVCFRDKSVGSEGFHNASTHDIDRKVCRYALKLNDTALSAKFVPADMIALEVKYHSKCLAALYNRARAVTSNTSGSGIPDDLYSNAFAESVAYVVDFKSERSIIPVFKLADIAVMYKMHLE